VVYSQPKNKKWWQFGPKDHGPMSDAVDKVVGIFNGPLTASRVLLM
jgi:hypothetical protein